MDTEEIAINQDTLLAGIQEAFSKCYPFLHLDFFELSKEEKSGKSRKLNVNTPLKRIQNNIQTIDISNNKTIAELSEDLKKVLGVDVQVSRKSGKTWNLISVTASWTLKSQNAAGEFICNEMGLNH